MDDNEQELLKTTQGLMEALMQIRKIHFKGNAHGGMKHSEMLTFMCIGEKENQGEAGIRVSDLGRILRVKNPTVTQAVNNLESLELVERSLDAEDRRVVRIKLTQKGRTFFEENRKKFSENIRGLVDYLGVQDSKELTRIVKKMYFYFIELSQSDL